MTPEQLSRKISLSTWIAAGAFGLAVTAYIVWFAVVLRAAPSKDPGAWGQFGDFVGGALNPLIAFLAFYWLTQSIRLQRQELTETKAALVDAAKSQQEHARSALTTARIHALSAAIHAHNTSISSLRDNIEFVGLQVRTGGNIFTPEGKLVPHDEGYKIAEKIGGGLQTALNSRAVAMEELQEVLATLRSHEAVASQPHRAPPGNAADLDV